MAQNKQGIHNSMLLEYVSRDSEHVTLRNVEGHLCQTRITEVWKVRGGGGWIVCTHDFVCTLSFCKANLRSALCFTISSAQGRTLRGTIGLYDLAHPRYTRRHLYTCISRSQAFGNLSCED